jgi:hypothetical protein
MPDSVIKKVEAYGTSTALPGIFDFADRNGILFEWNEVVDESPEGIVDIEDVVLYPSLAAEHPGVVLGQDQPLPTGFDPSWITFLRYCNLLKIH